MSVTVGTVNAMHSLMAGLAGLSRWGSSLPKSFAEKGQFYRYFLISLNLVLWSMLFQRPGECRSFIPRDYSRQHTERWPSPGWAMRRPALTRSWRRRSRRWGRSVTPGILLVLIHIWEFDSKTIYEKLVVAIFYCGIMAKVGNWLVNIIHDKCLYKSYS